MSGISPQSEGGTSSNAAECFQNYTAPEVFVQGLAGMVNQQDVETVIRSQKYMLQRFEKTNEMLVNCNALSAARYQNALQDFKKHTAMLTEMRKDVDNIFRRIRCIKAKISQQYPQAYEVAATAQRREKSREDDEDEEDQDDSAFRKASTSSSDALTKSKSVSISSPTSSTPPRSESVDIPKASRKF